jgi:hypothetical protein
MVGGTNPNYDSRLAQKILPRGLDPDVLGGMGKRFVWETLFEQPGSSHAHLGGNYNEGGVIRLFRSFVEFRKQPVIVWNISIKYWGIVADPYEICRRWRNNSEMLGAALPGDVGKDTAADNMD